MRRFRPGVLTGKEEDLSRHLPLEAWDKGWMLTWSDPPEGDPVFLMDSQRRVLYRWDYVPSLGEVEEACRSLLK